MAQAFDDLRVLDLCGDVAGAYAGKQFADFGADVVKVEPPGGDGTRREGPFPSDEPHPDRSATFLFFNRNKRGITLELDSADGRELLLDLVGRADIVLESFPPGWLEQDGLGFEALVARRPGLVLASLSPFGQDGPYAGYHATEIVLNALGGPMNTSGVPGRPPLTKARHLVAGQVGAAFASSVLAALLMAQATGQGQYVDFSAIEAMASSFDRRAITAIVYQLTGESSDRSLGSVRSFLPRGTRRCADGYVEIATTPRWVPRMLATIGDAGLTEYFKANPDAATDPATEAVVEPVVAEWLASHTKRQCMEEAVLAHGWPVFPLNTPLETLSDPNFDLRGCFENFDHPVAGSQRYVGAPWRMADGGFEARRAAPMLGQHNAEVFDQWLGRPPGDLALLRSLGAV